MKRVQAVRVIFLFAGTLLTILAPEGTALEQPVRGQGRLQIPQTYAWDLDEGIVSHLGEPPEAPYDFWYEAVRTPWDAIHRYLVPRNGAALAIVGERAVGYESCRSANLSDKAVNLGRLPRGTFLCARTNEGHYAEFSIDDLYSLSPASRVLTLARTYTTWER